MRLAWSRGGCILCPRRNQTTLLPIETIDFSAFVLLLAIGTLLIAGAAQPVSARTPYHQSGAGEDGCFVMRFSPTLGYNVGLVVTIDGRTAGAITRGHVFRRYLRPGHHVIGVTRNGRYYDALSMTLNVRPGQTYSYIAKYNVNQVILVPAHGSR